MNLSDRKVGINVFEVITILATLQSFPSVSDLGSRKSLVREKRMIGKKFTVSGEENIVLRLDRGKLLGMG